MAAVSEALLSMTSDTKKLFFAAAALSYLLLMADARAQLLPMGSGTNLSSVAYYEPPNEQHVKMRLSWAEMSPLPGVALYDVKKLKIESFALDGRLDAV